MDMKTYLKQATQEEREKLAQKVESTVGYFYQIAGGHKKPGHALCRGLVQAEPKLTLGELRPDIWGEAPDVVVDGPPCQEVSSASTESVRA